VPHKEYIIVIMKEVEEGETHEGVIMPLNEEENYDNDYDTVIATATTPAPAAPAPTPTGDNDDNDKDNDNDNADDRTRSDDDQSSSTTSFHTASEEEKEKYQGIASIDKNKLGLAIAKDDNDSYDNDDDIETGRRNSYRSVALTSSVIVLNPNINNNTPLTRSSTSHGIQPKPLPLMLSKSSSVVGAFAINNPLSDNETTSYNLSFSSLGSGSGGFDTNSTALTSSSLTRIATATTTTGSSSNNTNDDDNIYGSQHHVTEAVLVDVDRVVIASIVDNNNDNGNDNMNHEIESDDNIDNNNNNNNEDKKKKKTCYTIIGGIIIAVVVVIILLIVYLGGGDGDGDGDDNNNSNGIIPTTTTTSFDDDERSIRTEQIMKILAPISRKTPATEDAFRWLVDDDVLSHTLLLSKTNATQEYIEWKIQQRYILALFYFSTNGQDWIKKQTFLIPELDECDWKHYQEQEAGVLCNEQGRVERLRMWWISMSGTLPLELAHFSDSLLELNFAGGSITGTIPSSFEKLTNLEVLNLNDQCLSGTIPTMLSTLPKLGILTLAGNYELTGSLQGFCNGTQLKEGRNFVSANCDDSTFCPTYEFNDKYNYNPKVECDCCICCNPDTFKCCTPKGDMWDTYYKGLIDSTNGIPSSFDRPCLSEKTYEWLDEECPCFLGKEINLSSSGGQCTNDCTIKDAVPSYDPQQKQQ